VAHPYDLLAVPDTTATLIFTPCPGTRETSIACALDVLKATC
jgi:hypothetical protein